MIDKQDAQIIAEKLQARIDEKKGRPHDLAIVEYKGQRVAQFGIRHGSKKGLGHNHIPKDLHWSPHKCKAFSQCKYTRDQWIRDMIDQGFIDN